MLFLRRGCFERKALKRLKIVSEKGFMGVIREDGACVLPLVYDNVFVYGEDVLVMHQKGKIGAVRVVAEAVLPIAECEFDTLEALGHDLIFCNDQKVRVYFARSKAVSDFVDLVAEPPFLYAKDKKFQYILLGETGKALYQKAYTTYSESCFCFCGQTDKGPVFYDARYSTYLYPEGDGYKVYREIFNHPIIMNRRNVCNITEGEKGIGMIDSYGNVIVKNQYDSIQVELKITAMKGNETEQKRIPFQRLAFEKGMVSDIEEGI